jgi:hypothetical protein
VAERVAKAEHLLAPDVIHIRHTIGEDWSGAPAIYFRVLLSDAASEPAGLRDMTLRIKAVIEQVVDPWSSWQLVPHFNFRSESEQAVLQEPAWA